LATAFRHSKDQSANKGISGRIEPTRRIAFSYQGFVVVILGLNFANSGTPNSISISQIVPLNQLILKSDRLKLTGGKDCKDGVVDDHVM
jgi:hypothetical protein